MSKRGDSPWASGPTELLEHAVSVLGTDSDSNRRIAMILVDNAVEQAIKTYLSLPRRVSGINISRRRFAEIAESFPALLDALEEHAAEKLAGVDLGAIEWYHRLRNELYHQGFGLTVERDKVEVYAELAQVLLRNLFGSAAVGERSADAERIGLLIELWNRLEVALRDASTYHVVAPPLRTRHALDILRAADVLSPEEVSLVQEFGNVRNQVVHARPGYRDLLTDERLSRLRTLVETIERDVALTAEETRSQTEGDA